jgi:4-hydroxy-tetrahydrodipicolinate reductase
MNTTPIILLGMGSLGSRIYAIAEHHGCNVVATASNARERDAITEQGVVIDVTEPGSVVANVEWALTKSMPIVVGTTGWYHLHDQLQASVRHHNGALLWSSNFSIGAMAYFAMVRAASSIMAQFGGYDVAIQETHHTQKADSPSGTARELANIILETYPTKTAITIDAQQSPIPSHILHVGSLRVGNVVGEHTVRFDNEIDSITLTHTAHSRHGFALGALRAAQWLQHRKGYFTMHDMVESFDEQR